MYNQDQQQQQQQPQQQQGGGPYHSSMPPPMMNDPNQIQQNHHQQQQQQQQHQQHIQHQQYIQQQAMHQQLHRQSAMPHKIDYEVDFEIAPHYEMLRGIIGKGSYGAVCSAKHLATGTKVAIKKIPRAFTHSVEDTKRVLREIRILRQLNHQNIIKVKDIIPPRSYNTFKDIYIVLELMESDLAKVIYSQQQLSAKHIQYFLYQILRALKYLHSAKILHRDLKPSNLLLNSNCKLKICDFGLARVHDEMDSEYDEQTLTKYVVTRWYRAPELLLQSNKYSAAIDIWSVGCIFAEMLLRAPLFPGKDYINQLNIICHVLGTPSREDVLATNGDPDAMSYLLSKARRPPEKPLEQIIPHASPDAIDLLKGMLQFNPAKRITVDQIINHPYLKDVRNISAEILFKGDPNCFKTREKLVNQNSVKELIYREMLNYHPSCIYEEVKIRYTQNIVDQSTPFLIQSLVDVKAMFEKQITSQPPQNHPQQMMQHHPQQMMHNQQQQSYPPYQEQQNQQNQQHQQHQQHQHFQQQQYQQQQYQQQQNQQQQHPPHGSESKQAFVHQLLQQQQMMQQALNNVNFIPYPVLSQTQNSYFANQNMNQPILSYQDQQQMIQQQLLEQHQAHQQFVYGNQSFMNSHPNNNQQQPPQ